MTYMQVSGSNRSVALCSDNECPCGVPGANLPKGSGYFYISKEVVDFRRDCPAEAQALAKIEKMQKKLGGHIIGASGVFAPILMCVQGARRRGLDLGVAGADAKHWWTTGQVPLRPTPLAGQGASASASGASSSKRWWEFWK